LEDNPVVAERRSTHRNTTGMRGVLQRHVDAGYGMNAVEIIVRDDKGASNGKTVLNHRNVERAVDVPAINVVDGTGDITADLGHVRAPHDDVDRSGWSRSAAQGALRTALDRDLLDVGHRLEQDVGRERGLVEIELHRAVVAALVDVEVDAPDRRDRPD